jgi:hypothetical protein
MSSEWRPDPAWAPVVRRARDLLDKDARDIGAWADLAMMLGDTGATELGLCVALHANVLAPDDGRISGHLALFLLDLGLGELSETGVRPLHDQIDAWLDRQLPTIGGTLEKAAWHALGLAVEATQG